MAVTNQAKIVITAEDDTGRGLQSVVQNVSNVNRAADEAMGMLRGLGNIAIAGIAITQLADLASSLSAAKIEAERLQLSFNFSFGQNAAAEINFVTEAAGTLGISFQSAADGYKKIAAAAKGTVLEGQATRDVFMAIAEAGTVVGLTAEEINGSLLAVSQMISKGTVQSEELKGQLGERLPMALNAAAKAMGVTTSELMNMLEQGQVMTDDFLPKFAAELKREVGDSAEAAAGTFGSAMARMENAWHSLEMTIADSAIGDTVKSIVNGISGDIDELNARLKISKATGGGFWSDVKEIAGWSLGAAGSGAGYKDKAIADLRAGMVARKSRIANIRSGKDRDMDIYDPEGQIQDLIKANSEDNARLQAILKVFPEKTTGSAPSQKAIADRIAQQKKQNADAFNKFASAYASNEERKAQELAQLDALATKNGMDKDSDEYKKLEERITKKYEPREKRQPKGKIDPAVSEIDNLERRVQLMGQVTELERVDFEIQSGRLKNSSPALQAEARQLASKYDEKARLAAIDKQMQDEADKEAADRARRAEEDRKQQDDLKVQFSDRIKQQVQELTMMGLSAKQREKLVFGLDMESAGVKKNSQLYQQLIAEYEAMQAKQAELSADWEAGAKVGINDYVDNLTTKFDSARQAAQSLFKGMEDALTNFATTGKLDINNLVNSVIADMMRIQIQANVTTPLANWVSGLFSGGGTASKYSDSVMYELFNANGNAFGADGVHAFANGGAFTNQLFNRPTPFMFANGGGFSMGVMGEAGDEAVMPLTRDGRGRLGVRASGNGGGGDVTVNIIGAPSSPTVQKSVDSNGNAKIDVIFEQVKSAVARDIVTGGSVAQALQHTYGLNPAPGAN